MPVMMEKAPSKRRRSKAAKAEEADLRELAPRARIKPLSPAELDVVRAMVSGLSPKEVATNRGTSIATVRTQIKRAKKKTAARTLNELVAVVCMADMDAAAANTGVQAGNGASGL